MLDQNTDRMWYVIGAVIVGAAIIFLVNSSFPQLFASVGDTFKDKSDETMKVVDNIGPIVKSPYLGPNDLKLMNAKIVEYDELTHTFDMLIDVATEPKSDGFFIKDTTIEIPYGESIKLSYDVYIPEGTPNVVAQTDINNFTAAGLGEGWHGNDNDVATDSTNQRVHNDVRVLVYNMSLESGAWTTVWSTYSNKSVENLKKESLYDYTRFGVWNSTGSPLRVKIRNVKTEVY